LHVSARTLERKLRREGTTFTALLDNFRRNLALDFVSAPTFDARHVARSLGFTQRGAFSRAFKRWTGRTPERYRRAVLNVNEPADRSDVAFA
jgi:AraC-like DNA-binding protein